MVSCLAVASRSPNPVPPGLMYLCCNFSDSANGSKDKEYIVALAMALTASSWLQRKKIPGNGFN